MNRSLIKISFVTILILSSNLVFAEQSEYLAGELDFFWQRFSPALSDSTFTFSADVNGDGHTDLIITHAIPQDSEPGNSNEGLILFNNGDNTFTAAVGDQPVTEWVTAIHPGDFNGDGIMDIFIADSGFDNDPFPGFKDTLMLGTGDGFIDASDRLPDIPAFTHSAAVGDIENDGDLDIFVNTLDQIEDEVNFLLINDGDANFVVDRTRLPSTLTDIDILEVSGKVEFADMDSDGHVDLVAGRTTEHPERPPLKMKIFWNDGAGFFNDSDRTILPDMENFNAEGIYFVKEIEAFDFDDDNDLDLIATSYGAVNAKGIGIQFFVNLGDRVFVDKSSQCLSGVYQLDDQGWDPPYYLHLRDINEDGIIDIVTERVTFNRQPDETVIFEGSSSGKFRAIELQMMSDDEDVKSRLGAQPVWGEGVFGYAAAGVIDGEFVVEYVPVMIGELFEEETPTNACRNISSVTIGAAERTSDQGINTGIETSFTLEIEMADENSSVESILGSDTVSISTIVSPGADILGSVADIAVVSFSSSTGLTMRDTDGNWVPWGGALTKLIPHIENITLEENVRVSIFTGQLDPAADHRIFVGLILDDKLVFTPTALRFAVAD